MKYYKLSTYPEKNGNIVCYFQGHNISQNTFNVGKYYDKNNTLFEFCYDAQEGAIITDYIANDKGWLLVSAKLKNILETLHTEIQFLPVQIIEKNSKQPLLGYSIANIVRVVDALCLEQSNYFTTEVSGIGSIYTISKFCIYAHKTQNSDVFKLANRQEIPVFVSERFRNLIEEENITGLYLKEIQAV